MLMCKTKDPEPINTEDKEILVNVLDDFLLNNLWIIDAKDFNEVKESFNNPRAWFEFKFLFSRAQLLFERLYGEKWVEFYEGESDNLDRSGHLAIPFAR